MFKRFSRFWVRCFLPLLFLSSFTFCLSLSVPLKATPVNTSTEELVRQGVELYNQSNFSSAIALWEKALKTYQNNQNKRAETIVLENLARTYREIGRIDLASDYWQSAINNYTLLGDTQQVGRSLTEQAQVYNLLGQHRGAIALLCGSEQNCFPGTALQIARQQKDLLGEIAAKGSLGETYRQQGNYQAAVKYLEASLKLAEINHKKTFYLSALNSLGNTYSSLARINYRRAELASGRGDEEESNRLKQKAINRDRQALASFQKSLQLASQPKNSFSQIKVLLSTLPINYRLDNDHLAARQLQQALTLLNTLPEGRDRVYATIELIKLLQPPTNNSLQCLESNLHPQAIALLEQAVSIAQNLQDNRAQSFAFGELGHLYECRQEYKLALQLTQQARLAAEQGLENKDSLYQWEWQTGRIFKAQDKQPEAIAAYEKSLETLESIRDALLTANQNLQFDFRDRIEPIYRDLIALKLERVPTLSSIQTEQNSITNLNSALDNIDALRLAELQNYFGNDCAIAEFNRATTLTSTDKNTAIFNSIILPNRTGIIVTFPSSTKKITWIERDRESLRQEIIEFRRGLGRFFDEVYDTGQAENIYNLLIAPFAEDLEREKITTLVFIQDGILRSIPMAALYDGKQFLIQKYAIATTPSLKLTNFSPSNRQQLKALALGFDREAKVNNTLFPALPQVTEEVKSIEQELKGSKKLLNREFTRDRLQQELNQTTYPIIHIATHGEFGAEPKDTFLITGDRRKLTISELDRILRNTPEGASEIQLLALTACKTAIGDERSALGLAGVAVQAGVKSALASLWAINDTITAQLVRDFYAALENPNLNKAEALRQAQIKLIKEGDYSHPAYWSPFILIGNWL
ncbi:Tetratricopeptide TPR_1 repeat-containing protein [Stanieria cyanosphaera PCC 7437]|uniref:Tetratricopeptide TPR_1 repeat-containing protein n=1 Tax=Stanieria cyanosphaera (strain ATCC 29371 / PCC 7437) TaxID=111780 RepID=K9Y0M0_STAC7|nr:CHAT domain-containing protein [Stanieria cyanosphaera]AFZ37936.1 Tetratricopeptide TPR_1 repeat-containing protein [Stanieria cyanosphaera PCC 7437]